MVVVPGQGREARRRPARQGHALPLSPRPARRVQGRRSRSSRRTYAKPKRCSGKFIRGPLKGTWSYTYTENKDGTTHVLYEMDYELGGLLRFAGGLLARQYAEGIQQDDGGAEEVRRVGQGTEGQAVTRLSRARASASISTFQRSSSSALHHHHAWTPGRARAERLAVGSADGIGERSVRQVHARPHDLAQVDAPASPSAVLDDLEASFGLDVRIRIDRSVRPDRSRTGDQDSVTRRAIAPAEPDRLLERRART